MHIPEINNKLEAMSKVIDITPTTKIDVMGTSVPLPLKYPNASALLLFYPISTKEAKGLINDNNVTPIRLLGNTSLLGITYFNYRECAIGPYHEFTFSIPVSLKTKINVPLIPLIFEEYFENVGHYVALMGADTEISREHIDKLFPYPLVDKDLNISLQENNGILKGEIIDGNELIVSSQLICPKKFKFVKRNFNTIYKKDDSLFKVKLNTFSYQSYIFNTSNIETKIGNNTNTKILHDLKIKTKPIFGVYFKQAIEIAGKPTFLNTTIQIINNKSILNKI
jgi:hypothetical protein